MAIDFSFSVIDELLSNVGSFIAGFIELIKIVFNNITFILLFLFFIGFIWAIIKVFDFKKHQRNIERGKRNW